MDERQLCADTMIALERLWEINQTRPRISMVRKSSWNYA